MSALARGDRIGQPRPGLPRHRRARRDRRAPRSPRSARARQPVPARERRARAAPRRRRAPAALLRAAFDPDAEVLVTAGATEAIASAILALAEPGDEVVLFEPYYDSYAACVAMAGGVAPCRSRSAPPDWSVRTPTRSGRGHHAADPAAPAELAAQPDGQGLQPRRARPRSPAVPASATCSWSPTRSTSTSCSTASTCRSRRCRDAGADRHDLLGGQDLLLHRLEGRLGCAPRPAHRRGAHGEAVPHLRQQRRRSSTRSPRAWACRTPTSPGSPPSLRAKRDLLSTAWPRPGSTVFRTAATFFVTHRHPRPRGGRRDRVLPAPAAPLRRGRDPQRRLLRRRRGGPVPGPVRVLQAAGGAAGGTGPAGQGAGARPLTGGPPRAGHGKGRSKAISNGSFNRQPGPAGAARPPGGQGGGDRGAVTAEGGCRPAETVTIALTIAYLTENRRFVCCPFALVSPHPAAIIRGACARQDSRRTKPAVSAGR